MEIMLNSYVISFQHFIHLNLLFAQEIGNTLDKHFVGDLNQSCMLIVL